MINPTKFYTFLYSEGWKHKTVGNMYIMENLKYPNQQLVFSKPNSVESYNDVVNNVLRKLSELTDEPIQNILDKIRSI